MLDQIKDQKKTLEGLWIDKNVTEFNPLTWSRAPQAFLSKPADSYFTHNSYKANDFICQPKCLRSSSEGIHRRRQEAPACFIVIQFHSENIKEK